LQEFRWGGRLGLPNRELRLKRSYGQSLRIENESGAGAKVSFVVSKHMG